MATIKHVPAVEAVNVALADVLLSVHPVALPPEIAYVTAPVPLPPEVVAAKTWEYG